ncbi:flavin-containing monooxygenase 5-like [Misgurnus anguillicaudatus]|uniref:flavin-containing monooxygenase 5-like n=1 Tax=Misgurnus anguillicaudatus TaxID=75329 RepID=UPI003CCFB863
MAKRVAVIGAGHAGLVSIKCCLDEGLEPVCFESSDDIGGLWRFKETHEAERTRIYRSLVVNTSKEMMCFSDFPMPDHFPNYLHNSLLLQYLRLYAKHFGLLKHIQLKTTVSSVRERPDFSTSGQWDVVTVDRDGREEKHVFDGVLVCTGQYTQPNKPLSDFKGSTIACKLDWVKWIILKEPGVRADVEAQPVIPDTHQTHYRTFNHYMIHVDAVH